MNHIAFNIPEMHYKKLCKKKDFYRQREGDKEVILGTKADWLWQDHFSLGDRQVHRVNYFMSTKTN